MEERAEKTAKIRKFFVWASFLFWVAIIYILFWVGVLKSNNFFWGLLVFFLFLGISLLIFKVFSWIFPPALKSVNGKVFVFITALLWPAYPLLALLLGCFLLYKVFLSKTIKPSN